VPAPIRYRNGVLFDHAGGNMKIFRRGPDDVVGFNVIQLKPQPIHQLSHYFGIHSRHKFCRGPRCVVEVQFSEIRTETQDMEDIISIRYGAAVKDFTHINIVNSGTNACCHGGNFFG